MLFNELIEIEKQGARERAEIRRQFDADIAELRRQKEETIAEIDRHHHEALAAMKADHEAKMKMINEVRRQIEEAKDEKDFSKVCELLKQMVEITKA